MTRSRSRGAGKTDLKRGERKRPLKPLFLIVCEGEKTEPNYFKNFRVPNDVRDIHGLGKNTVSLVEEALRLRGDKDYTQVWCVFDRDSFPAVIFNKALSLAKRNKIQVAYSNEAFELWYLLHYHYYDSALDRHQYIEKLTSCMGKKYEKNSPDMYDELEEMQPQAIENAKRLLSQYVPPSPEKDNPSTTVHVLVEELNKFSK